MQLHLFFHIKKNLKMKTKIIFALVATVALCAGIYYYFTKVNIEPPIPHKPINNIVGTWKIDSVYNNKDSNSLVLLVLAFTDSTSFKFNADSTLEVISPKETETQHYVLSNDSLVISKGNELDTFYIKFKNDSLFSALGNDSSVLVLKRITAK